MTVTTTDKEPQDNSTYSKFLSVYTRSPSYVLLASECRDGFSLEKKWPYLSNKLILQYLKPFKAGEHVESRIALDALPIDAVPDEWATTGALCVIEYQKLGEAQVRGIILREYDEDAPGLVEFHGWFGKFVVKDSRVDLCQVPCVFDEDSSVAEEISRFFAEELKNTTSVDQWDMKGKDYFVSRVKFFTQRGLTIEAVLPAFPCKSSNLEKVAGVKPDKGEELALRRIIQFGKDIKKVYPPGMKLLIVSDGHVFSDCIGVDDDVVDAYTEQLKEFYYNLEISLGCQDENLVGFVSLKDLFFQDYEDGYAPYFLDEVTLDHYTGSKICEDAELSRKMLMAGCDTDAGQLRADTQTPNHPRLGLYRGFNKFMCEDLSLNQHCKTLSKSAFKKTVSKVAFEMIKRNDAYSNLVELIYPFHMRLSIHAHVNSGPKFGVKLIDPKKCRVIKSLGSDEEPSFADLLHIPTPWHNTIVKIDGSEELYMSKAKVVQDAINAGHYRGEFVEGEVGSGEGGYYHLFKKESGSA